MPIDLTEFTFNRFLTTPCRYNSTELSFGCVIERRFEQGRPGVAGEYRPEIREGSGNHATIRVRMTEPAFASGFPKVGESVFVPSEQDASDWQEWRIRGVKPPYGGCFEMLCEIKGTRAVNAGRGDSNVRRVNG